MIYTDGRGRKTENPFDLLERNDLVDDSGSVNSFYRINANSNALEKLTLSDFINNGIEKVQEVAKSDKESSGDSAKIGSSGDYAQIGSSGDSAKIGSSGDSAKIGSSGYYAQIGSSGDYAKIGSSGDSAQIGSSGYYAKIGSSGDSAQIKIKGKNSIVFACGYNSMIQASNGTWISLAEYKKDKDGIYVPCYAKSVQIGKHKDAFGNILNEHTSYMLVNKKIVPVLIADGNIMIIFNKKLVGEFEIYKTQYLEYYRNKEEFQYVAKRGEFTAHGATIKEAISDVEFKFLQSQDVKEHVKRIRKQGYMTANDYRLLTGACRYGTNKWLEENGYTWEDKKSVEEVVEMTKGQYGHERLVKALKEGCK